eukprot:6186930-Pleurochrysis_carterae.AAC.1
MDLKSSCILHSHNSRCGCYRAQTRACLSILEIPLIELKSTHTHVECGGDLVQVSAFVGPGARKNKCVLGACACVNERALVRVAEASSGRACARLLAERQHELSFCGRLAQRGEACDALGQRGRQRAAQRRRLRRARRGRRDAQLARAQLRAANTGEGEGWGRRG